MQTFTLPAGAPGGFGLNISDAGQVLAVVPGTVAEQAGVCAPGLTIVSVNGTPVSDKASIVACLRGASDGPSIDRIGHYGTTTGPNRLRDHYGTPITATGTPRQGAPMGENVGK